MLRKDRSFAGRSGSSKGTRLSIAYTVRPRRRACERRVIYLSQGVPPITGAEVEIMHAHLEACSRLKTAAAENDND